jgi:hypothetical protein
MARKKMSNLQVVKTQDDRKALRQRERRIKRRRRKELLTYIILIAMAICGTYLLLDSKTYGTVRKADSYAKDLSDRNNYVQFADGIVRFKVNACNAFLSIPPSAIFRSVFSITSTNASFCSIFAFLEITEKIG